VGFLSVQLLSATLMASFCTSPFGLAFSDPPNEEPQR